MSKDFEVKPRFHLLLKKTYKPLKSWVRGSSLPAHMPHLNEGLKAQHIELRAAGHCMLDGKGYEFQDILVYVDMTCEGQ